jgi:glycine cleavage system regulatory protein
MISLILTVVGQDRPGLVEMLARTVAAHQGNWLDSHLMRLAGKFAGVVRVEVVPTEISALRQALEDLAAQGLEVRCVAEDEADSPQTDSAVSLSLVGSDRPGIVREISRILASKQVNVIDFHSETSGAPMTGGRIFQAAILVRLPEGCPLQELQQELEKIAADLMVDVHFN